MSAPVLQLSGVTREHRQGDVVVPALCGVDLAVSPGELVAVVVPLLAVAVTGHAVRSKLPMARRMS